MKQANIEVRVALLRSDFKIKDLAYIFKVTHQKMSRILSEEWDESLQEDVIKIIENIASGKPMTEEDVDIYIATKEQLSYMARKLQCNIDERTLIYVNKIEKLNEEETNETMSMLTQSMSIPNDIDKINKNVMEGE